MVWRCRFENYLITAMLKALSQQLQDTLTAAFERHWKCHGNGSTYVETDHGSIRAKHAFNKILPWLNMMKWRLTKVHGKLSVEQKSKTVCRRALQQNRRWYFTDYCSALPFLSNKKIVFQFNLVLIK